MDGVPASRRPPGAPRRVRRSVPEAPPLPDRQDTTPLDIPAPPRSQYAADDQPTTVLPKGGGPRKVTVTRVAVARSRELTAQAAGRVRAASRADGAGESGLTQLL